MRRADLTTLWRALRLWLPYQAGIQADREFSSIIITAVYIPPQADTSMALNKLYLTLCDSSTDSKTRLKHFVYIVCLKEGSELLRNSCCFIERNGIFDIGQSFFTFSGSRFGSFKRGFITAPFSEFGTHPVDRETFIMFNNRRAMYRKQLFQ